MAAPTSRATAADSVATATRLRERPSRPRREISPASSAGGTATAGPNTAAAAWRRRSAGSMGPTTRAARSSADGAQSRVRSPPSSAARRVSADGRADTSATGPADACTAAAPAATAAVAESGDSPPGACTWTSTGSPVAACTCSTRLASRAGERWPAPSEVQIAAAPGRAASARASSIQRGSPGAGAGPTISVGTNSTPASSQARATGAWASGSLSGSVARIRRTPLSAAQSTKRRTTSAARGRSPQRFRAPTTTPTGVVPTSRRIARRRSQGLSDRASSAARAQRASSTSRTRAPTSDSADAATARSSVPTAVPQGNGARSRRVAST